MSAVADIFCFPIIMALTRGQKEDIIEDLTKRIERQNIMIFIDFSGLKVQDMFELRKKLKSANSQFKVAKKTLFKIAFKNYDSDLSEMVTKLKGEIAVIFGFENVISPAKIAYQFAVANPNLKILGGYFEGKYREAQEIIILAQLPTRDELLTQLVRSILAPISNLLGVLEGNLKGLIFALSAIKKNKS